MIFGLSKKKKLLAISYYIIKKKFELSSRYKKENDKMLNLLSEMEYIIKNDDYARHWFAIGETTRRKK